MYVSVVFVDDFLFCIRFLRSTLANKCVSQDFVNLLLLNVVMIIKGTNGWPTLLVDCCSSLIKYQLEDCHCEMVVSTIIYIQVLNLVLVKII